MNPGVVGSVQLCYSLCDSSDCLCVILQILKTWPLTTVRRWAASPNSFTLVSIGRYAAQIVFHAYFKPDRV